MNCGKDQAHNCRTKLELKAMMEENNLLRIQLSDTKLALKRLTDESSQECFDERRVNLLKLHNFQLQRQVLLMNDALGSRLSVINDTNDLLRRLADKFRYYIGLQNHRADVLLPRCELMSYVEQMESARRALFKTCHLETKLSALHGQLTGLNESLKCQEEAICTTRNLHLNSHLRQRALDAVQSAIDITGDSAADLLSLSFLIPSSAWVSVHCVQPPAQKRLSATAVTYASLAPYLSHLPRSKAAEVELVVTAALRVANCQAHMNAVEASALRQELDFHRSVYGIQLDYIHNILAGVRDAYKEFEISTNDIIIQPMNKLLKAFERMKEEMSDDGLRHFLSIMKSHHQQWKDSVEKLSNECSPDHSASGAISAFGEEFLALLNNRVKECQAERDDAVCRMADVKARQEQLNDDLHNITERVDRSVHTT